jgi:hypothetical protein
LIFLVNFNFCCLKNKKVHKISFKKLVTNFTIAPKHKKSPKKNSSPPTEREESSQQTSDVTVGYAIIAQSNEGNRVHRVAKKNSSREVFHTQFSLLHMQRRAQVSIYKRRIHEIAKGMF